MAVLWVGCTLCVLILAAFLGWSVQLWPLIIFSPIVAIWLGVPLLSFGVLTFLVWRFAPKFARGHCRRCGYNLKGSEGGEVSGVWPSV